MIDIQILKCQGVAPAQPVSAQFGTQGGTIGRAGTNTLVLDDPDRTISRVHARVLCRDGRFFIIDQGSNPMLCDGQAPGRGVEVELHGGERLTIGSFELMVQQTASGAKSTVQGDPTTVARTPVSDEVADPFANLLDGLLPESEPAPVAPPPVDEEPYPDPMGNPGSSSVPDPFADLLQTGAASGGTPGSSIPSDLSDLTTPTDSSSASSTDIDALFGLGGAATSDPLAMGPLADPMVNPNTAQGQDPLASLQQKAPVPTPESCGDTVGVEHFGFIAPRARPVSADPADPLMPADTGEGDGQPVPVTGAVTGSMPPVGPDATALPADAAPDSDDDLGTSSPSVASTPHADLPSSSIPRLENLGAGVAAVSAPVSQDPLLAAFLRGLGAMPQAPQALDPELMERIGTLLRLAVEGTLQLLLTRQELKQEVRAQVTMIAAQANNPLKFSPTVEVALGHLLGPRVRGFMPAEEAMRDAYQDLRAHEFGMMVGLRAALANVIEQFSPDALEQNITTKSALDAVFRANRKARLWNQFIKLYDTIAQEAEDDFHSLFGRAFLKAYEEQMARLKSSGES